MWYLEIFNLFQKHHVPPPTSLSSIYSHNTLRWRVQVVTLFIMPATLMPFLDKIFSSPITVFAFLTVEYKKIDTERNGRRYFLKLSYT